MPTATKAAAAPAETQKWQQGARDAESDRLEENRQPAQVWMDGEPDPKMIERLAYECWEERGRPDGSAEVDWLLAEQILRGKRDR